jgi:Mrp family chromosome partitioning ATPase
VVAAVANGLTKIQAGDSPTLGITSTLRGEGRTTIALAAAIVERYDFGRKTILLDLDLANPSVGSRTGAPTSPGLADYLLGTADLEASICWHDNLLGVVTAGSYQGDPERLVSGFLRSQVLEELGSLADVVVADLPPLPPAGAGARLAPLFATVMMVVRAGSTSTDLVAEAIRSLPTPPPAILNHVDDTPERILPRSLMRVLPGSLSDLLRRFVGESNVRDD